jgi:hypothetical protein
MNSNPSEQPRSRWVGRGRGRGHHPNTSSNGNHAQPNRYRASSRRPTETEGQDLAKELADFGVEERADGSLYATTYAGWLWLRRRALLGDDADAEFNKLREIKGHLNKLSSSNFETLSSEIASYLTGTVTMDLVVELVYQQALLQTPWGHLYAHLASKLSQDCPTVHGLSFRDQLLDRSLNEFRECLYTRVPSLMEFCGRLIVQHNSQQEDGNSNSPPPACLLSCKNLPTEVALYLEQQPWLIIEKKQATRMQRFKAVVDFLGQLYGTQLLSEQVLDDIFSALFRAIDAGVYTNIEILCILVKAVGKPMESASSEVSRARLDNYMSELDALSKRADLSPRFRFIAQDVLDLRKRKWKPIRL